MGLGRWGPVVAERRVIDDDLGAFADGPGAWLAGGPWLPGCNTVVIMLTGEKPSDTAAVVRDYGSVGAGQGDRVEGAAAAIMMGL